MNFFVNSLKEYHSLFFKTITIQLLSGLQERAANLSDKFTSFNKIELDGTLLFVGESFSRICRRGSSGKFNNFF